MALQDLDKKDIKVTLVTKVMMGSERETYELVTFGTKFWKDSALYFQYTEESEAGKTLTTVKYKEFETLLLRNGAIKMRQLFHNQKTTNGHYKSIYGTLAMVTHTTDMKHVWNEETKEGQLQLKYQMQMQGAEPGNYEMTITYKEEA